MCYHISFELKLESITDYFPGLIIDSQPEMEFTPSAYIDGFLHQPHRVLLKSAKDDKLHYPLMLWGFLPDYLQTKEEAKKYWGGYNDAKGVYHPAMPALNAKAENLFSSQLHKESAFTRRCIILIDGFYEWHHLPKIGKKGQELKATTAYPFHIFPKNTKYPFLMVAGVWKPWKNVEIDKETGEVITRHIPLFEMVTTVAIDKLAKIHNKKERMITILTEELAREWMEPGLSEERIMEIAMYQEDPELIDAYSIDRDFTNLPNPKQVRKYEELDKVFC